MNLYERIVLGATLVVGLIILATNGSPKTLGATDYTLVTAFPNGIEAGASSITGVATLSGGTVLSGTNTISGTTTVSTDSFSINQATTTTAAIGTANTGCLKMGNSNGSTTVPVYITVTGSTITASTTKPGICK